MTSEQAFYYPMSNQELADAITAAQARCGIMGEIERRHLEHMHALLAVQLERAKQMFIENENDHALVSANKTLADEMIEDALQNAKRVFAAIMQREIDRARNEKL